MAKEPADDPMLTLAQRIENHLNTVTAESRATRTILEVFLRRFLEITPRPHQAFEALKADTVALLGVEAQRDAGVAPNAHRAAEAALFQAEAIFSELEAMLSLSSGDDPPLRN